MHNLIDLLPGVANRVQEGLIAKGREDLAQQIPELVIFSPVTHDERHNLHIYTSGSSTSKAVGQKESISFDDSDSLRVDVDTRGRVVGIEVLEAEDVYYDILKIDVHLVQEL